MAKLTEITSENPLLLIGCGKMGGALLQGWLKGGLSTDVVHVVDPYVDHARKMAPALPETFFSAKISDLPSGFTPGFIILAVKPQVMDQALADFKAIDYGKGVFLSIAAGKTIGYFKQHLGGDIAIIRAMPNTPAAIGKGITVACPNRHVTDAQRAICHDLLAAAGAVEWVRDEALIDAVTAVSGSGPAYLFHMVEALAGAGEKIGLDKELAYRLASHTICGAGALLEQSGDGATQLRKNVTSPKGTTEAALNVLMSDDGLPSLMTRAVTAAHKRSRELAE